MTPSPKQRLQDYALTAIAFVGNDPAVTMTRRIVGHPPFGPALLAANAAIPGVGRLTAGACAGCSVILPTSAISQTAANDRRAFAKPAGKKLALPLAADLRRRCPPLAAIVATNPELAATLLACIWFIRLLGRFGGRRRSGLVRARNVCLVFGKRHGGRRCTQQQRHDANERPEHTHPLPPDDQPTAGTLDRT